VSDEGQLIRRERRYERDFTQIRNKDLRDEALSFRARGILAFLLTHKPGFTVTLRNLAKTSPTEGLDAIRTAVNELERHGYLRRYTKAQRGRFTADDWELCDPNDALESPLLSALDHPTRARGSASGDPTRTALDHPTLKNTRKNTPRELPSATTEGPVDNSPRALALRRRAACIPPYASHLFVAPSPYCVHACGTSTDGDVYDPRTGELMLSAQEAS